MTSKFFRLFILLSALALTDKQAYGQPPGSKPVTRDWYKLDPVKDSIAGINLAGAYNLVQGRKYNTVIVAVIDNGVDVDHDQLKDVIWTNTREIEGNGIDDDRNGYADDIHGWNFRGKADGTVVENEQLASVQLYLRWKKKFEKIDTLQLKGRSKEDFDVFRKARKDYREHLKKNDSAVHLFSCNPNYNSAQLIANDNGAARGYGSPAAKLSNNLTHGTHVAGIVAGIADYVLIMPLLATTAVGDERDKDVANAIVYAVDNGARVINMSFSKLFSEEKELVDDAIRYAERKGVLIVHAAGNDGVDIDSAINYHYPIAIYGDGRKASNFVTVGWSRALFDYRLAHPRSNYGQKNVDLFAPGSDIFSTLPGNQYGSRSGSSMSAPMVSAVAAMLMSYFPSLTARDVKEILLKSSFKTMQPVNRPMSREKVPFNTLSVSGGIVNVYGAVGMAIAQP